MAILFVSSARKLSAGNSTCTFGVNKEGAATLTGIIYDASGVIRKRLEGKRFVKIDSSDDLYMNTVSITFAKSVDISVVEKWFANETAQGFIRLNAGLELECSTVSEPELLKDLQGEPVWKVFATCTAIKSVENPPTLSLDTEDEALDKAEEARNNATERKTTGLFNYLANKAKQAASNILLDTDAQDILNADKTPTTTKKAANTRVKVAK